MPLEREDKFYMKNQKQAAMNWKPNGEAVISAVTIMYASLLNMEVCKNGAERSDPCDLKNNARLPINVTARTCPWDCRLFFSSVCCSF